MSEPMQNPVTEAASRDNSRSPRDGRPAESGTFELTARCNLDCKMCYVHKADAAAARREELSTREWEAIFDDAIAAGMKDALLTGGECLLRDDFETLYRYLLDRGITVSVFTNGLLLTEHHAALFAQYPPERLQISLYGSSDDAYERVTGHREYDRIIRALDLLDRHGIRPEIAVTVSRPMADDFLPLLRLLRARGLNYLLNFDLIESREGRPIGDYLLDTDAVIKLQKIERLLRGKRTLPPAGPVPAPGCAGEPGHGMPCKAGSSAFTVLSDGKMVLCQSVPEIAFDVRTLGFDACWAAILRAADAVLQPADCLGCAYLNQCTRCPAKRFDGLFSGRCRAEQCALTVARYRAGLFRLSGAAVSTGHSTDGESRPE